MREEPKPSALSVRFVQEENEQDDAPGFTATGGLSDFLIRRQLLTMEGKRIQELIVESDADIEAAKDHLSGYRDTVLADLRNRLAGSEWPKRRPKLRELPRTAERYIRIKMKRRFASVKSTLERIGDNSDATRVQGRGWHLPEARQLDAWAAWFAENDPSLRKARRFRKERIQVALVASGGIGDVLKSTQLVGPISDHFSCDLTIITGQRAVGQLVEHNPYVRHTLVPVTNKHEYRLVDQLRHLPVFDLIIQWKYLVEYIVPIGSRIEREHIRSLESKTAELRAVVEKYCSMHLWPKVNFALSRDTSRLGLSVMKVSIVTSGVRHRTPDSIPFFPGKESLRVVSELLMRPYITVHHGFDVDLLPARTRTTDYNSTKNLSMQQWRQIVAQIRQKGIEIIQLGVVGEEKIAGVTHCLNGQISLEEAGLLIKHGICHIDTEGGLVHLANAVHGRCVVLFGPTPAEFFGYPQNINLEPSGCKSCWFVTQNWLIECPRHTSGPECMREHSASAIVDAADGIMAESEHPSAKLIAAETRSWAKSVAQRVAAARTLLGPDASDRILIVLDDLRGNIASELSDSLLGEGDVIICADEPLDLEPGDRMIGRFEYGSLLNLPRASSSVDAAVWISREPESDIAPFALRELFRVLRPGGGLLFAAAGESTGLDLRGSLSAGRIAFDGDEMPSAPVYSCLLRKSRGRPEGLAHDSRSPVSARSSAVPPGHGRAIDPRLAMLEEENGRQIALARDKFAERQKIEDETWAVVDEAVQRGFGADGWIWVTNSFADGYASRFFMRGWHESSRSGIWSREDKCLLMLPYPGDRSARGDRVELQLQLVVPKVNESRPVAIGLRVNDGPIEDFALSSVVSILNVVISIGSSRFRGLSQVEFQLGALTGDKESKRPPGDMAMAVRRFRYRLLDSQD